MEGEYLMGEGFGSLAVVHEHWTAAGLEHTSFVIAQATLLTLAEAGGNEWLF